MARCPAAWTHSHTARGLTTTPLAQPSSVAAVAKWHKDRQGTAQVLELTTGPLMRVQSQSVIQGRYLGCLASLGAPSDPAAPLDWPKEACDLALRKAFTVQARPTQRAAGPGRRVPGTFGQLGFDEVHGERAGHLPRRQD